MTKIAIVENDFLVSTKIWTSHTHRIYWSQCVFSQPHYHSDLFTELNIDFPTKLKGAVIKRQSEFLAGRYVAKLALSVCQYVPNTPFSIPVDKQRCPIWPTDYIGSISHFQGLALCAIAHRTNMFYLGIDIEPYLSETLAKQVAPQVDTSQEVSLLKRHALSHGQATTLLFSAKESFFKAIYPQVGEYFGFECIYLTALNMAEKKLIFETNKEFAKKHSLDQFYQCQFQLHPDYVMTLVMKEKTPLSVGT